MAAQYKLTRTAVRQAARRWREDSTRYGFRNSSTWDVIIDGKRYPPKPIISFANEILGNPRMEPGDFKGARTGPWHAALEKIHFKIVSKGTPESAGAERNGVTGGTIFSYRDDPRFAGCSKAILVTAERGSDSMNRALIAEGQPSSWVVAKNRAKVGDALFLLVSSPTGRDGYPCELYGSVINADPSVHASTGGKLVSVSQFVRLTTVPSNLKKFLGGRVPVGGDGALTLWDDIEDVAGLAIEYPQIASEEDLYPEGATHYRTHRRRERNRGVVALAKILRFQQKGKLECEVCDFDFSAAYGQAAPGYIEAHHKIPVAATSGITHVRKSDFELVCANCHRMLHRMSPLMTAKELRARFGKQIASARVTSSSSRPMMQRQ